MARQFPVGAQFAPQQLYYSDQNENDESFPSTSIFYERPAQVFRQNNAFDQGILYTAIPGEASAADNAQWNMMRNWKRFFPKSSL